VIQDDRIAEALAAATAMGERGLQVAAYLGNTLIVDAWSGEADSSGRNVTGDTLFPVFSASKAITATALHIQAERGLVHYEMPVAEYWPEFGQHGKDRVLVRHVLSHQSGIAQMPVGVTPELLADWDWMTQRIAEYELLFEPGTASAYQSLVFGWIVGEIVRRTDPLGRSYAEFVREELCEPLGIHDLWFGVPAALVDDVAELTSAMSPLRPEGETEMSFLAKPDEVNTDAHIHNLAVIKQAVYPGAGGIMTARAGARVMAMLANGGELDGVRLLSEGRVRSFLTPRANGELLDGVLFGGGRVAALIGVGGYWLGGGDVFGNGTTILRHGGAGGALVWADLDRKVGVMISHNRMFEGFDPRTPRHPFASLARAILDIAEE
jgi:CubicO group peptidase (beta-lactamase class C family)